MRNPISTANRPPIRRPSLWLLVFMVSLGPFGDTEYTPSLPDIAASFGVHYNQTILTMSSYLLGFAISQLFYGPISDRFGRRPTALVGISIFVAGSVLCLISPNLWILIISRFIQAIGACSGTIMSNAAVRDSYPENIRGAIYARINAAFAIAPGIGPVVGAYVATWFHWRVNFVVILALSILLLVTTFFRFNETNLHLNMSALQPKQTLMNYLSLFKDPYYPYYVTLLGLAVGMVYNCLTEAPDLVTNILNLGRFSIVVITAGVMLGFIAGSLACNFLFNYLKENTIIGIGLFIIICSSLSMFWTVNMPDAGLSNHLIPIIIIFIGVALILPMATARAMAPFSSIAGSAAAVMGFTQMTLAATATWVLSFNHQSTVYVMPVSFTVCGVLGATVYILFILMRPNKERFKET